MKPQRIWAHPPENGANIYTSFVKNRAHDPFSSSLLGEQGHCWHRFQGAVFCQGGPEDMTDSRRDSPKEKQIRTQKTVCSLFIKIIIIILHFFHRTLKF